MENTIDPAKTIFEDTLVRFWGNANINFWYANHYRNDFEFKALVYSLLLYISANIKLSVDQARRLDEFYLNLHKGEKDRQEYMDCLVYIQNKITNTNQ